MKSNKQLWLTVFGIAVFAGIAIMAADLTFTTLRPETYDANSAEALLAKSTRALADIQARILTNGVALSPTNVLSVTANVTNAFSMVLTNDVNLNPTNTMGVNVIGSTITNGVPVGTVYAVPEGTGTNLFLFKSATGGANNDGPAAVSLLVWDGGSTLNKWKGKVNVTNAITLTAGTWTNVTATLANTNIGATLLNTNVGATLLNTNIGATLLNTNVAAVVSGNVGGYTLVTNFVFATYKNTNTANTAWAQGIAVANAVRTTAGTGILKCISVVSGDNYTPGFRLLITSAPITWPANNVAVNLVMTEILTNFLGTVEFITGDFRLIGTNYFASKDLSIGVRPMTNSIFIYPLNVNLITNYNNTLIKLTILQD